MNTNENDININNNEFNNGGFNNNGINNQFNNEKNTSKKGRGILNLVPYLFIVGIIVVIGMLIFPNFFFGEKTIDTPTPTETPEPPKPVEPPKPKVSEYKIFDTTSNNRPYAIVVNNTPVAVKVQEGLNKAYIVYEIPTEGYTSRLLAVYKDVKELTVGTIRSCRHNFMDFAHEHDAIIVCFGWSIFARKELLEGFNDFLNGNESQWASAFWRSNPEKLATEHTAYTSLEKLNSYTKSNKYRLTSDKSLLLNYSAEEVNLDSIAGSKTANTVTLPYGSVTTKFTYDPKTKMYTRIVNGTVAKDHKTKEPFTTRNIIIVKAAHTLKSGNYYWDLKIMGKGKGYYVTNGKYIPITWQKDSRTSKSKYFYPDGTEIKVNDGRTYIEVHDTTKTVSIN